MAPPPRSKAWLGAALGVALLAGAIIVRASLGGPQRPRADDATFLATARAEIPRVDRLSQEAAVYGQPALNTGARALRAAIDAGERTAIQRAARALRPLGAPATDSDLRQQAERLADRLDRNP
jgi:hypothetical protein